MTLLDEEEADFIEQLLLNAPGATNKCGRGCYHPSCKWCKKLLRSSRSALADHPDTILGALQRQVCKGCDQKYHVDKSVDHCLWCGAWTFSGHCSHCRQHGYPRIY